MGLGKSILDKVASPRTTAPRVDSAQYVNQLNSLTCLK